MPKIPLRLIVVVILVVQNKFTCGVEKYYNKDSLERATRYFQSRINESAVFLDDRNQPPVLLNFMRDMDYASVEEYYDNVFRRLNIDYSQKSAGSSTEYSILEVTVDLKRVYRQAPAWKSEFQSNVTSCLNKARGAPIYFCSEYSALQDQYRRIFIRLIIPEMKFMTTYLNWFIYHHDITVLDENNQPLFPVPECIKKHMERMLFYTEQDEQFKALVPKELKSRCPWQMSVSEETKLLGRIKEAYTKDWADLKVIQ